MGVRFGTYATFWVRAAITHALHEQTRVVRLPSKVHVTYNKIKRATDELSQISPSPTDDAVAEELKRSGLALSPQRIRNVIKQIKTRPKSLDTRLAGSSLGGSEGSGTALVDIVEDRTSQRVEAKVVQSMLRADLVELMRKHLRTDEAQVLTLRFGLADGATRTIKEVGEEMGMSYATVKQRLYAAMGKMRKPHIALALRDYLGASEEDALV